MEYRAKRRKVLESLEKFKTSMESSFRNVVGLLEESPSGELNEYYVLMHDVFVGYE